MKLVRLFLTALVAFGVGGAARAQSSPSPAARAETHLHLSADASVLAPPDVLVADMLAEAASPSVADAQRRVNVLVAQGMKQAGAVSGIDARAVSYAVQQVERDDQPGAPVWSGGRRTVWQAQQTIELRGGDGGRLLDLAGKLQAAGLAAASIEWQLSPAADRKAHDGAMASALEALQIRAAVAAGALGLKVLRLEDVRVDMPEVTPPRPMMAMALKAMPAPEATDAPQSVTSTVSADIVLGPP